MKAGRSVAFHRRGLSARRVALLLIVVLVVAGAQIARASHSDPTSPSSVTGRAIGSGLSYDRDVLGAGRTVSWSIGEIFMYPPDSSLREFTQIRGAFAIRDFVGTGTSGIFGGGDAGALPAFQMLYECVNDCVGGLNPVFICEGSYARHQLVFSLSLDCVRTGGDGPAPVEGGPLDLTLLLVPRTAKVFPLPPRTKHYDASVGIFTFGE